MAGVQGYLYSKTITWNSLTWQGGASGTGGVITTRWESTSEDIEDRTNDDMFAPNVYIVDGSLRVTVSLRENDTILVRGAKSNMVLTLSDDKGNTSAVTFVGMMFSSANASQDRATPGEVEYTFIHESADGQAVPMT